MEGYNHFTYKVCPENKNDIIILEESYVLAEVSQGIPTSKSKYSCFLDLKKVYKTLKINNDLDDLF